MRGAAQGAAVLGAGPVPADSSLAGLQHQLSLSIPQQEPQQLTERSGFLPAIGGGSSPGLP